MKGIEAQLKKIEKIADDIEKADEHAQYEKYKHLFNEAIRYIKSKHVLLYGGMAMNDLFSKKDKIYADDVLPDIDIFSENGKKQADEIVKYFVKKGFNKLTTSYTEALHAGTYKVFIDSVQVFDITTISKRAFKRLKENSVRGDSGIPVVNPQFLRLSLHMIMSQSHDARRWSKVFKRLLTFYKYYPPKECKLSSSEKITNSDSFTKLHHIPEELIINTYKFLEDTPYILFGINEITAYLKNYSGKRSNIYLPPNSRVAPVQMLVQGNILEVAHALVKHLNTHSLAISEVFKEDEFIPDHIIIKYKSHPCIEIYNTPVCMTYVEYNKIKIASIHTILRMYLSMVLSTYNHFETENHSLECLVNVLSTIQQKMSGSRKKIFQQLIEQCYGPFVGIVSLRRERVLRMKEK